MFWAKQAPWTPLRCSFCRLSEFLVETLTGLAGCRPKLNGDVADICGGGNVVGHEYYCTPQCGPQTRLPLTIASAPGVAVETCLCCVMRNAEFSCWGNMGSVQQTIVRKADGVDSEWRLWRKHVATLSELWGGARTFASLAPFVLPRVP